jgi:putative ABC transport system permease protein
MKEIGIRKVVGASRPQLIKQFIGESVFYCLCSFLITPVLIEAALPWFNEISGKEFTLTGISGIYVLVNILGIILFVGIAAGSFPAFLLSSYQPTTILSPCNNTIRNFNFFNSRIDYFIPAITVYEESESWIREGSDSCPSIKGCDIDRFI